MSKLLKCCLSLAVAAGLASPSALLLAQNGEASGEPALAAEGLRSSGPETPKTFAPANPGAAEPAEAEAVAGLRDQAALLARENRLDEAVEILSGLHAQYPDDRQVLFDYVAALSWNGEYERAASLSAGFDALDAPDYALAAAAQSQRHSGRLDRAESFYRQGLAKYPHQADFAAGLALTLADSRRFDEARAVLERDEAGGVSSHRVGEEAARYIEVRAAEAESQVQAGPETVPPSVNPADHRRDQAVNLARKGDYAGALSQLKRLHEEYPGDQAVLADYITIAAWAGSNKLAATLTKKLKRDEAPEYALSSGAAALRKSGRFREARKLYEYSVRRFPQNLDLKIGLALTLGDGGAPYQGLDLLKAEGRGASKYDGQRLAEARTYLTRLLPPPEPYKLPARPETDYRSRQDQAAVLAREGRVSEGLAVMADLRAQYPQDQHLLFDHITLLQWARENEQALALRPEINPRLIPPYAVEGIYRAYAARRDYAEADAFLEEVLKAQRRNPELLAAGARLIAEHGNPYLAASWIDEAERAEIDGLDRQIEAVKKDIGYNRVKSLQELDRANRYLAVNPSDQEALRLKSQALSGAGATILAREQLAAGAEPPVEQIHDIELSAAMKEGRWGEQTSLTRALAKRAGRLEASLNSLGRLESRPDCRSLDGCLARVQLARVQPLAALNRSREAVEAYEAAKGKGAAASNAALLAAGGAYINLREPRKAAEAYQEVVDRHQSGRTKVSRDDLYEAEKGLFWAYLEADDYREAREQARSNHVKSSLLPPGDHDWHKVDSYNVLGLAETFTDNPAEGEAIFSEILKRAPTNAGALSGLSAAKSARGLPRAAWESASVARLHEPDDLGLAVQLANTLMDLRRWEEAHALIKALTPWAERSEAVKLLLQRWEDHNLSEFHSYVDWSHSTNKDNVGAGRLAAPGVEVRLYSPPLAYNWRPYLGLSSDSGRYSEGNAAREIYLAGAEYRGETLEMNLELRNERIEDRRTGVGISGVWQPDDHWRFPFAAQRTSRETPLRARNSGIHADSVSLGAGYYWNESRSADFNLLYMNFSDGNKRLAAGGRFSQRLWTDYGRFVTGRLNFYASFNSEDDNRPYFNPAEDLEAGLGLSYGSRLWRDYDKALSHAVDLDLGRYSQKHYEAGRVWKVGYGQMLTWTGRFSAAYGLGYGRRVYDGEPEKIASAYLNMVWKF